MTKSKTSDKTESASLGTVKDETASGRVHHRVPVQLLVDYRANGHYLFDFCRDLGTGGVFIETKTPLSQGSIVELVFTLPDSKETLEAKGRVIWCQAEIPGKEAAAGMGVQFEEFTADQRSLLQKFIDRYRAVDSGESKSGWSA